MKKYSFLFFILFTLLSFGQNEQLAQNYFDRGEFEKALISYEELLKSQPNNYLYFQKTVDCYQQLQQYDKSLAALQQRFNKYFQASILVDLGYNYQLQKNIIEAKKLYDQAIEKIEKNPNEVYTVAAAFEKKVLIDYAILAYQTALEKDNKLNFNYQLALLYGQKGDSDKMIEMFLTESERNPQQVVIIQNQLSRFMNEDASLNFNEALKRALLLRIQKSQDISWNQYLSWYYSQLKEYNKAFIQEKAIYKRNPESFSNIVNLGQLAIDENDDQTATEILNFVLENTNDIDLKIKANAYLVEMKIKKATSNQYLAITQELDSLLKQFGENPNTLELILLKAHFTAFQLKKPDDAKTLLKRVVELPLNREQMIDAKMELADILLLEEKFNQALLYYSQIENEASGAPKGQEASLKIAKTSYYQTDFKWANQQLGVLKSASTQLIANDALDLFLLISDNTVEDSTQVALKKFAHADFLIYQDKNTEAVEALKAIIKEHKGQTIEPVALLRLGKIYERQPNPAQAIALYQQIIDNHKDCIYIDEALYFMAEIYEKQNNIDKAKAFYEQIITNHQDSIYYVDSQKKYRKLRGDKEI